MPTYRVDRHEALSSSRNNATYPLLFLVVVAAAIVAAVGDGTVVSIALILSPKLRDRC